VRRGQPSLLRRRPLVSGEHYGTAGTGKQEDRVSKRAVRVHLSDSVATALDHLEAGDVVVVSERDGTGFAVTLLEPVPFGHKVAVRAIAQGEDVIKYGESIGEATASIPRGGYVHTHNVASRRAKAGSDNDD